MIKQKPILSMITLFFIAIIIISAYAADAATNTTTADSDITAEADNANVSNSKEYDNNWTSSALNSENETSVQLNITGPVDNRVNFRNTSIEIIKGNKVLKWNYTVNNSEYGENGYGTLRILAGSNPLNFREKINYTAIVDAIGMQEAQFGNIQHVTIYGIDDESVIQEYGYGDCWADACWLYNKLSAAGVQVRIMGYEDGGIDDGYRHTWIEINIGNGWQTWNYTKYNSQHAGDNGYGTPFVLIGPDNAPADIMKTGY